MTQTKGRQLKEQQIKKLREKISGAKSIIFANYHGLSAIQMDELRKVLIQKGADAHITRNTLLKIALKKEDFDSNELDEKLTEATVVIYSNEDAISGIKQIVDFCAENDDLPKMKAGIVEGKIVFENELITLSNLPTREQLLTQVVGVMNTPITGFVTVLGGVQSNFVRVLSAIAQTKES